MGDFLRKWSAEEVGDEGDGHVYTRCHTGRRPAISVVYPPGRVFPVDVLAERRGPIKRKFIAGGGVSLQQTSCG